ncbi:NlpC/P60 family protein [Propionibacterium sp.]|uniref:C40 family peptidase n=1 Tax=Propionibacterium sp. TaxID=1977903 RepID=UPI0039E794E2
MGQHGGRWIAVGAALVLCVPLALLALVLVTSNQTSSSTVNGAVSGVPSQYEAAVSKAGTVCQAITAPVLAAQIAQESNWNPQARSGAGAEGISQFLPATWASAGVDGDGDGKADIWNPADAIISQGHYMCDLASQVQHDLDTKRVHGDLVSLTLAAYNAGLGNVEASGGSPGINETITYVSTILGNATHYLSGGASAVAGDVQSALTWAKGIAADNSYAYVWGGDGQADGGYDCSGLTQAYAAKIGVSLPRTAADQSTIGHQVSQEAAQPGDLIFWGAPAYHTAIYLGDGQMVSADNEADGINTEAVWGTPTQYRSLR